MKSPSWMRALGCALLASWTAGTTAQPSDDPELVALRRSYASKYWTFTDERSGDCHMSGVLTIFSNGRAIWTATTATDSTSVADIWHASFEVLDAEGKRLFGLGVWDSPGMQDDGSYYFWKKTGDFPKAFFGAAAKVNAKGEC